MKFFRRVREKKKESKLLSHYAPDVELTPVEYLLPLKVDDRINSGRKKMDDFLKTTEPDAFNKSYLDRVSKAEEEVLCYLIEDQQPSRLDICNTLALKHRAEKRRLEETIADAERMLEKYTKQLAVLQQVYDVHNRRRN